MRWQLEWPVAVDIRPNAACETAGHGFSRTYPSEYAQNHEDDTHTPCSADCQTSAWYRFNTLTTTSTIPQCSFQALYANQAARSP